MGTNRSKLKILVTSESALSPQAKALGGKTAANKLVAFFLLEALGIHFSVQKADLKNQALLRPFFLIFGRLGRAFGVPFSTENQFLVWFSALKNGYSFSEPLPAG